MRFRPGEIEERFLAPQTPFGNDEFWSIGMTNFFCGDVYEAGEG
jgi:hypothetical protein